MKILIDFYVTNEITSNQARIAIKCYNEKMFEFEKFKICEKFFKSNSNIRILCFTDVMKLSMNIIDIDIVIQWNIFSNFRVLMQRAERTAKNANRVNEFIWLYSKWCVEKRTNIVRSKIDFSQLRKIMNAKNIENLKIEINEIRKFIQKKNKNYTKKIRRDRKILLNDDFWRIFNESSICIRKILLKIFNEFDMNEFSKRLYEINCCFHCFLNKNFIFKINFCKRIFFKIFSKTFFHQHRAVETVLKQ